MTRLQKYKEFFIGLYENAHNGYSYDQATDEYREFIKNNSGSLDAIVANTGLCSTLIIQGEFKKAEKIVTTLELTGNDLVDYFIYNISSLYYGGINDPNIDSTKADEFHNKAKNLAEKIIVQDGFEEGIIEAYNLIREIFRTKIKVEKLELTNKLVKLFQTNHDLGYFSDNYLVVAGTAYASIGKFEKAIEIYKHCYECFIKSEVSLVYLSNLSVTYFVLNELEQAKSYLTVALQKANQSTNYFLKTRIFEIENLILEHEQKYDEEEENLLKQLELAKEHQNNLKTSYKELNLFQFYINRFKKTENNEFLKKAKKTKEELQLLTENSDDVRVKRRNSHAKAMLLSLGSLKQKAKAVEIYEELCEIYPYDASYKLELIDLYWDDLKYDVDGESKKQIDQLLTQLESYANVQQNASDNRQVSIQILLAKYDFYINQNKEKALDSLYAIQSKAHSIGQKLNKEKISKEIRALESDLEWKSTDYSIKERLEKVKFKSYIEGAQLYLHNNR